MCGSPGILVEVPPALTLPCMSNGKSFECFNIPKSVPKPSLLGISKIFKIATFFKLQHLLQNVAKQSRDNNLIKIIELNDDDSDDDNIPLAGLKKSQENSVKKEPEVKPTVNGPEKMNGPETVPNGVMENKEWSIGSVTKVIATFLFYIRVENAYLA